MCLRGRDRNQEEAGCTGEGGAEFRVEGTEKDQGQVGGRGMEGGSGAQIDVLGDSRRGPQYTQLWLWSLSGVSHKR